MKKVFSVFAIVCAVAQMVIQPLTAQSVKQITVTVVNPTILLGARTSATAQVRLANGRFATNRTITWTTSKPSVALISSNGVISSLTVGTASIIASVSGVSGTAPLTVTSVTVPPSTPASVASVSLSLASSTMLVGAMPNLGG